MRFSPASTSIEQGYFWIRSPTNTSRNTIFTSFPSRISRVILPKSSGEGKMPLQDLKFKFSLSNTSEILQRPNYAQRSTLALFILRKLKWDSRKSTISPTMTLFTSCKLHFKAFPFFIKCTALSKFVRIWFSSIIQVRLKFGLITILQITLHIIDKQLKHLWSEPFSPWSNKT